MERGGSGGESKNQGVEMGRDQDAERGFGQSTVRGFVIREGEEKVGRRWLGDDECRGEEVTGARGGVVGQSPVHLAPQRSQGPEKLQELGESHGRCLPARMTAFDEMPGLKHSTEEGVEEGDAEAPHVGLMHHVPHVCFQALGEQPGPGIGSPTCNGKGKRGMLEGRVSVSPGSELLPSGPALLFNTLGWRMPKVSRPAREGAPPPLAGWCPPSACRGDGDLLQCRVPVQCWWGQLQEGEAGGHLVSADHRPHVGSGGSTSWTPALPGC